jgi:alkanesulfonate monooxygenase SsuD/methylene tetrahydromethanopterin reductase-like flavin-dependent oxidoreductase (luciferase family)
VARAICAPETETWGVDGMTDARNLKCGVILPGGSAAEQVAAAVLADEAGWDGVFVWEAAYGPDAWSLLAAAAVRTSRVKLGTMLTPLPWRRPWKAASQAATVDQLSGGRAVIGVGLGALDPELPDTGEETDRVLRAEMLDEGIDLMRTLWSGGTEYRGRHYRYSSPTDDLVRAVRPVQPSIPVWVVGAWPRPKSMRRALRCDGLIPEYTPAFREGTPEDLREIRAWLAEHGVGGQAQTKAQALAQAQAQAGFDVICEGETPADDRAAAAAQVAALAEAGGSWWLETRWGPADQRPQKLAEMRARIAAGPPRPWEDR